MGIGFAINLVQETAQRFLAASCGQLDAVKFHVLSGLICTGSFLQPGPGVRLPFTHIKP